MVAFLNRIVPTFSNASRVLLTGSSAGGFGAAASAELVQWAFGCTPVNLLDDSGPPMSSTYLPTCLQDTWRTTWGLDGSILADCGADCPSTNDFIMDYALHVGKLFKGRPSGLIETTDDSVITLFFSFGQNNCAGGLPLSASTFTAGLNDFRSQIGTVDPDFGTYYISGTQHTWLLGPGLYTETVNGTSLISWISGIANSTSSPNVGP